METFVAIDFETADTGADSACAAGLVRVERGVIVAEAVRLIRPPRPHVRFTHIHGLTWEDLKDAPTFGQVWPELAPLFEGVDFAVAHNSSFDRRVLMACCQAHGLAMPNVPFRCTVQMARQTLRIFPTKLSNVCEALGLELKHHEALSDARACANIAIRALAASATPASPTSAAPLNA